MSKLYRIEKDERHEWLVVHIATSKAAFFGTKRECREWIERNGHDDDV